MHTRSGSQYYPRPSVCVCYSFLSKESSIKIEESEKHVFAQKTYFRAKRFVLLLCCFCHNHHILCLEHAVGVLL